MPLNTRQPLAVLIILPIATPNSAHIDTVNKPTPDTTDANSNANQATDYPCPTA